jgi:hypothetical protein
MHGAVNQAVEDLIVSTYDERTWLKIKKASGFTEEMFLSNEPYPDQLTFDLVVATNQVTGLGVEDILLALGEHWVLETGVNKYGALLKSGGNGFEEFIMYLPKFHGRVMMLYPNIIPPEFEVEKLGKGKIMLQYHSKRDGLTMFVFGLLVGIGKMFDHPITIEIVNKKLKGSPNDSFLLNY